MAIDTTATEAAPYYDDWSTAGNSEKNYLKILFQPGRSVQVRELNQVQSGIQAQIDKFGSHIFKAGSRVLDGEINSDNKIQWVDLTLSANGASAAADSARPLIGKTLFADASLTAYSTNEANIDVAATIMDYELKSGNEYRFYLRYASEITNFAGGNAGSATDNSRADVDVRIGNDVANSAGGTHVSADAVIGSGTTSLATGYALKLTNNKGIYFAKGYFVEVAAQTKYIDVNKTDGPRADLDGAIGFIATESTRTAVNDNTLYDTAAGTTNFSAPGADRYVITLNLCLITDDTNINSDPAHVVPTSTANAIDIVPLIAAEVYQPVETKYDKLGDTLAQRTYEESGDYALQPFTLDLREHLDTGFNRGKFTSTDGGDAAKMVVGLEPSIAYVKGKRIEILKKQEIVVDKARDTDTQENISVQARQGSYIELDSIEHLPNPNANAASGNVTYTLKTGTTGGSGNTIATGFCRGIEKVGRKFRFYISPTGSGGKDITMVSGKKLSEAQNISGDDVTGDNTFKGVSNTNMRLKDVGFSSLIFPIGVDVIKSLSDNSGVVNIPLKANEEINTGSSATTSIVLGTLSNNEAYYHDNPTEYIITKDSNGAVVEATNVILSSNNTVATLTVPSATYNIVNVTFSKRKPAVKNVKAKATHNQSIASATYTPGQKISLAKTDIVRYNELAVSSGGADLSANFILQNGQTDTGYGNGFLVCIKAITTAIYIDYVYFNHTTANADAFWVDSYTGLETTVARSEVPFYKNNNLTDVLDFRGTNTAIDPNGVLQFSKVEHYLNRTDKLVLKSSGELEYLKGDSETNGSPETPADSMLLYDLGVPAYTDSVQQIQIGYQDNKRYTMRDIGKIETRVKNLEYYSSLSLLEKMTSDSKILDDATQADRFKNGIIVDEFRGHGIGNTRDPGYAVAIDTKEGILRPSFTPTALSITNTDNTAKDISTGSTNDPNPINNGEGEDSVRLPSTSINKLIEQPFASIAISVNPFDVASWVGDIKISPESDEWRDTTRRPDVIIQQDGNADAIMNIVNERLASSGTQWNDWETTWSGVTDTENLGWNSISSTSQITGIATTRARRRRRQLTIPTFNGGTVTGNTRASSQFELEARTTTTEQIREGIKQFARIETITESLGDKVVDVSFVPFIRSRKVYFRGTGLKPNTAMIPFFDGVDVSSYVKTSAFKEYRDEDTFEDHTNDSPGNISSDALVTNKAGTITGYLIIPNNDELRFRTGDRELLLVDNPSNLSGINKIPEKLLPISNSFAKADYSARGLLQTVEKQILSTRKVVMDTMKVFDERTLTSVETAATGVRHVDPIAQTFIVDLDLNPGGAFLHDIDIFFSAIHSDLPVHFRIVTAENGIPTQNIVPFSKVTKYPSRQAAVDAGAVASSASNAVKDRHVAIADTNAANATKMVFESPVYLKAGVEYAFVLLSNSPEYMVWHSEVGGTDITAGAGGKQITKNPYTGVALKSANASTWTPDQSKDIKFTINIMKFFESGAGKTMTIGADGETVSGFGTYTTHFPTGTNDSAPIKVDAITLNSTSVILPGTNVGYLLDVNDGVNAPFTYVIEPGKVLELPNTVTLNGDSNDSGLTLRTMLATTNKDLTPMVDVTRLSLLCIKNNIDGGASIVNESAAGGVERRDSHGSAAARYITKPVSLANASSQLNVFMDISRPRTRCNVDVYARFDGATGNDSYIKLEGGEIPIGEGFREIQFRTPTTGDSELQFSKFQIKIVLRAIDDGSAAILSSGSYITGTKDVSENSALVPEIRNFRAIATA